MLNEYDRKRDFEITPEPGPRRPGFPRGPLTFVVQKHSARQLHYDFRLEIDGVLKSWAVSKGPSLDPAVKRLAVMVEDHPIEYGGFEGIIPPGQYGAGQVIVWDTGSYSPDDDGKLHFDERDRAEDMARRGLEKGKLSLHLRGSKMKGSWALVRMHNGEKNWLLIKHRDEFATPETDILDRGESALSGMTIDDLKAGVLPHQPPAGPHDAPASPNWPSGAVQAPFPDSLQPMLATLTEAPFSAPDWLFEPKLDGFRMIAFVRKGKVRLQSRRGLDDTSKFPEVAQALLGQASGEIVLDGELVALDEANRPCFQCLQQHMKPGIGHHGHAPPPIVYYVFDMIYADGYDLRLAALTDRRKVLKRVLMPSAAIQIVESFAGNGNVVFRAAVERGFEGVMAKRMDSVYEPGKRSRDWLKIKATMSDDFVIAGYTLGQGARSRSFGALILGSYDKTGQLVYAGHVGSRFDDKTLAELKTKLDALRSDQIPFNEALPVNAAATWIRPELVAEVKFAERTEDGLLRAPVFMRLREDKSATGASGLGTAPADDPRTPESNGANAADQYAKDILEQLKRKSDNFSLVLSRGRLQVSKLDKPLWPPTAERRALTKRDLLEYLAAISPYLLPHLKDRPLTLTRYPNGIGGSKFYQKHYDQPLPGIDITAVPLASEHDDGVQKYLTCNNLGTLLWLGQIADLELHTWFSRTSAGEDGPAKSLLEDTPHGLANRLVDFPDFIVFDLDPYMYSGNESKGDEPELHRAAFSRTCEAALWLKEILDELSLAAFVKTSGRTGIHVYVPILRHFEYKATRTAAETIGRHLLVRHPKEITMEWAVEKRTGKIFVDHNRNARGQTLASIYSPRPSPQATVSMPLHWEELGRIYPTDFDILSAPARLKKTGDLWSNILEARNDLRGMLHSSTPTISTESS